MSSLNQDIQASYQIISLLERSKSNYEEIIDRWPDIFCVIDENGAILLGNKALGTEMHLSLESLIGTNISSLFKEETWRMFKQNISESQKLNKFVEFELPADKNDEHPKTFYWSSGPFQMGSNSAGLYTLIGRDITLLRSYQKQLSEIFVSIPLAIFTIDYEGNLQDTCSAYTKWLLGVDQPAGCNIRELLVEPTRDYADAQTREGWNNLLSFGELSIREFEALAETFPTQFYYPLPNTKDQGRYLGMKVQKVVRADKVSSLLIILEDRTLIVETEKMDEKNRLLQNMTLERALHIKKANADLLEVVISDLKGLFSQLSSHVLEQNLSALNGSLHSIKGNARLVGFKQLIRLTHETESIFSEQSIDWEKGLACIEEVRSEWREIISLYNLMTQKDEDSSNTIYPEHEDVLELLRLVMGRFGSQLTEDDITNMKIVEGQLLRMSYKKLQGLEKTLREMAIRTSSTVGHKVHLTVDWDGEILISEKELSDLRTCANHLITNSIAHGIEDASTRAAKKKSPIGNIRIAGHIAHNKLVFNIEDDGAGFDVSKIKSSAVSKGLVTLKDSEKLSAAEAISLIFLPGFSTANQLNEIKSRGIGLHEVHSILEKRGGSIAAQPSPLGGAQFKIIFPLNAYVQHWGTTNG